MSEEPACLILMKTDFAPEVSIGAVLCGMKSPKTGLIGNGESFVFRVECEVESWFWHNGKPTQFAHFSPGNLNIGNGALMLNDDFKNWNVDKRKRNYVINHKYHPSYPPIMNFILE